MADLTITRSATLPDSANKSDFHDLIDTATATITNLVNADIASGANIADSKLAQITTAGKVSGAALTSLTSIPSGAGKIPVANIDTGTTANKIVKLDASAKLPAVDGSALTGIGIGALVDKSSSYGAQQAATDGFLIVKTTNSAAATLYSDGNVDPTTVLGYLDNSNTYGSCMIPVKKGNYWKVVLASGAITVFWIPLGA